MDDPAEKLGDEHAPSEDDLRGACEDLLRSWEATYLDAKSVTLGREDQQPDEVRFILVLAFAAHAHHVTARACEILDEDDYATGVPLLRVAYESALTAVWVAESEDAGRALSNKYRDDVRALRGSVQATGWFDELLDRIPEPDAPVEVVPRANGEAAAFSNLCQALEPHSDWLYTTFRLLSAFAHPSGSIVEMFVPGTAEGGARFSPADVAPNLQRQWWHAAALTLLHAGQAFDRLDHEAPRKELLASTGELLGWDEPLRLTQRARQAVAKARAARRDK